MSEEIKKILREAKKLGLTKEELLTLLAKQADEEGMQ